MELAVWVGHHVQEPYRTRGRGGPGGWIWATKCTCGWLRTSPNRLIVDSDLVLHQNNQFDLLTVFARRSYWYSYGGGAKSTYWYYTAIGLGGEYR